MIIRNEKKIRRNKKKRVFGWREREGKRGKAKKWGSATSRVSTGRRERVKEKNLLGHLEWEAKRK